MFLKKLDLTASSRPILSHDETLLFVQDNVGLYEGSGSLGFPAADIALQAYSGSGNTKLPPAKRVMHI